MEPTDTDGAAAEEAEELDEETETPVADLLPQPTEPDELERQSREHHEAPHFRKESD